MRVGFFFVTKNGINRSSNAFKISVPAKATISDLFRSLPSGLRLESYPKSIYDESGKLLTSLSAVPDGTVLVISCGEEFIHPPDVTQLKHRLEQRLSIPLKTTVSFSPAGSVISPTDDIKSTTSRMTRISFNGKGLTANAQGYQSLVMLPGTLSDHIRDSLLAADVGMEVRWRSEEAPVSDKLLRETQLKLFKRQLFHGGIGLTQKSPQVSHLVNLEKQIQEWAFATLDRLPIDRLKLKISGPSLSGKSCLLEKLAEIVYRKVLNSNHPDGYFIFPFNFELHGLFVQNPAYFYGRVVSVIFESIHYARFDVFPFLGPLKEWFLFIPQVGSLPSMPGFHKSDRSHHPVLKDFDVDQLFAIGTTCHAAFHGNSNPTELFSLIFSLPAQIANVLSLIPIYIIDHCDVVESVSEVVLAQLQRVSFVIAAKDQNAFRKLFAARKPPLQTDNIVNLQCQDVIAIGRVKINIAEMRGYPGFVVEFLHICEALHSAPVGQSQGLGETGGKSKVIASRKRVIVQMLKRLLISLREVNQELVTEALLNELTGEQFKVRLLPSR